MKKTIAAFMTVICLVLCCGNIIALAATEEEFYKYCPYCQSTLDTAATHISEWSTTRVFTDSNGAQVKCYETYSVDRIGKICRNGHGTVQEKEVTTETHTLSSCPYKK